MQIEYPNDRVDNNGYEWPTVGENIRHINPLKISNHFITQKINFKYLFVRVIDNELIIDENRSDSDITSKIGISANTSSSSGAIIGYTISSNARNINVIDQKVITINDGGETGAVTTQARYNVDTSLMEIYVNLQLNVVKENTSLAILVVFIEET